jgi:hypothetical protein
MLDAHYEVTYKARKKLTARRWRGFFKKKNRVLLLSFLESMLFALGLVVVISEAIADRLIPRPVHLSLMRWHLGGRL